MNHRNRSRTIALMLSAGVILPVLAANGVPPIVWETGPSYAGTLTIDANSLGPSLSVPGTTGVWVYHSPTMSVDCSPPRGCYATTQRIYYVFNCAPRYAMPMERISMDLNGKVVKHEVRHGQPTYSQTYDEAAHLVLDAFCRGRDHDRDRR
jgi:hypothetical protein